MPTTHFPSGATATTFPHPGRPIDLAKEDHETLAKHGLPPRPPVEQAEHHAHYIRLFGGVSNYIVPTFVRSEHRRNTGPTVTSTNWSGVVVTAPQGHTFFQVTGIWNVPQPNPERNDVTFYASSNWVGIDGPGDTDVFQVGCGCDAQEVNGNIHRTVYLWWDWAPENEVAVQNFPVSAGDEITVSLTAETKTSGLCTVRNATTGHITGFGLTAPTGTTLVGNTAEWIVERPEVNGATSILAAYGTVNFSFARATLSNYDWVWPGSGSPWNMDDDAGNLISKGEATSGQSVQCTYVGPQFGG